MKKFKVTGKDNSITVYVSEEDLSEKIKDWGHGLPERPEIDEMGQPTGVILPAEYTVEIEDISAEHALKQVISKRRAEYPSAEEFLNAYFDGGQVALDALQVQRLAIKAKYPKP